MIKLLKDFRTWLILFGVVVAVAVGVTGYAKLPERVDANESNIDQLAGNVNDYILEQRTIQKEQEKREVLMVKLIETSR